MASRRISKKLWWLEPVVDNWGWVGLVITRLTGGVSAQAASLIASMLTDTIMPHSGRYSLLFHTKLRFIAGNRTYYSGARRRTVVCRKDTAPPPFCKAQPAVTEPVFILQQFHKRLQLLLSYFAVGNSKIGFNFSRSFMELL